MSSVIRGRRDTPLLQTCYIVRSYVDHPIGSTPIAIINGIAAANLAGNSVVVIGSDIITPPDVYLANYFNCDVYLNGGDLLRDLGNELTISYDDQTYIKARLVQKISGQNNTQTATYSTPFWVTVWESSDVKPSNVFVSRL